MKIVYLFLFAALLIALGASAPVEKENVTYMEKFVSKMRSLVRFAGGINLQAKLSNNTFSKITSDILKFNSSFVKNIKSLQPDTLSKAITKIAEKSPSVQLGHQFDMLEYGMSQFAPLFKHQDLVKNGIDPELVKAFREKIGSIANGENAKKLQMLITMRLPLTLLTCLKEDVPEHRLSWCYSSFNQNFQTLQDFKETAEYFMELEKAQKEFEFARSFHEEGAIIEALSATINVVDMMSRKANNFLNVNATLEQFRGVFKTHFDEFLQGLEGTNFVSQMNVFVQSVARSDLKETEDWHKALPRGIDGLRILFENLDGHWMKKAFSVGSRPERLEKGLRPLKKYTGEVVQIRNHTKKWGASMTNVYSVRDSFDYIEKWMAIGKFDGHYDVPYLLFEPFRNCLKDIPKLPTSVDLSEFTDVVSKVIEVIDMFKRASEIVEEFHKNYKMLDSAAGTLFLIAKSHFATLTYNADQQTLKETFGKMKEQFIELEGPDGYQELLQFTKVVNQKLGKDFDQIESMVSQLPDNLGMLTATATALEGNSIVPLMKCSTNYTKSFMTLKTIMDGAKRLAEFTKKPTTVEAAKNIMADVSKVQKLLVNAENHIRSSDEIEVQKVKEFGKKQDVAMSLLEATLAMGTMDTALSKKKMFNSVLNSNLDDSKGEFPKKWERRGKSQLKVLLKELDALEKYIQQNGEDGLKGVEKVLVESSKMKGVTVSWEGLDDYLSQIKDVNPDLVEKLKETSQMELGFASFSGHFHAASLSTTVLNTFLYDLESEYEKDEDQKGLAQWMGMEFPIWTVVFLVVGVVLVIVLLAVIAICLSPYGRNQWRKFYLRRYGSQEEMELYWRYSYWTDQEGEKNALCEAVREINYDHVKAIVERGAYINVYNSFGNTSLHAATKYGHAKIVELLIKNGADRNAYNFENRTPEQLLDESSGMSTTTQLKSESTVRTIKKEKAFLDIENIFKKYQDKICKQRVPDLVPTMAFRIRIDPRIIKNSVTIFTEKYKGNVTDQVAGVTHLIVPTDKNGVLVSDDFDYIMCVFLPTLLMKEQWMRASLEKKSNFRDDYKFRVEKVRYKGKEHGTVLKWAQWVHKQTLPFLFGVQLHLCAEVGEAVSSQLRQLVEMHGATWCEEVPVKEQYNIGSHPFHHFHLGPLFVIHSNNVPSMEYLKNDDMYTLMTFDGFVEFMLKMEVKYDPQRRMPIPVKSSDDISTGGVSTKKSSTK